MKKENVQQAGKTLQFPFVRLARHRWARITSVASGSLAWIACQ